MHELEGVATEDGLPPKYKQRAILATQLQNALITRRIAKDNIALNQPIVNLINSDIGKSFFNDLRQKLGNVRKVEKSQSDRKYFKRNVDETPVNPVMTKNLNNLIRDWKKGSKKNKSFSLFKRMIYIKTYINRKISLFSLVITIGIIVILMLTYVSFCIAKDTNENLIKIEQRVIETEYQYNRIQTSNIFNNLYYMRRNLSYEDNNIKNQNVEQNIMYIEQEMLLPESISGSFKSYMDYKKITDKNSIQWKLQQYAETNDKGFRVYEGKYMIALGTYYSSTIGDIFIIEIDSDLEIECIVGDIKNDKHTDKSNRYNEINGNIVEFIIDVKEIDNLSKIMGDMSYSGLEGDITGITRILYDLNDV